MLLPENWLEHVQEAQTEAELARLHRSVGRGSPFGDEVWVQGTARNIGLESSLQPRGRPLKRREEGEAKGELPLFRNQ